MALAEPFGARGRSTCGRAAILRVVTLPPAAARTGVRRTVAHRRSRRPGGATCPTAAGIAWLRRGDGMIGVGEVARFEGGTAAEADAWWPTCAAGSSTRPSCRAPWHRAGGVRARSSSTPTTRRSARCVVVPRVVVGRRSGRSWLTTIAARRRGAGLPRRRAADPPAAPAGVAGRGRQPDPPGLGADRRPRRSAGSIRRRGSGQGRAGARAVTGRAERHWTRSWLVAALADRYPTCWTYHVDGLVGASPEMLIRSRGRPGHLPGAGRHDPPQRRGGAGPQAGPRAGPLEQEPDRARAGRRVGGAGAGARSARA